MSESQRDLLSTGISNIEAMSDELNISSETTQRAIELYEQAVNTEACEFISRGSSVITAAVLLIACRETGDVRTSEEIAAVASDVTESNIYQTVKCISSTLNIGLVTANIDDYIDRIGDILQADAEDVELAKHVVSILDGDGVIVNQAPRTVAATAFYYVGASDTGHGKYTQSDVADAVNISTPTIRNNYNKYSDALSEYDETPVLKN